MMDKFYKVDGHSGLLKNPVTGTILNANTNEIQSARARKANKLQGIQETQQMKDDITQLKNDMSDIKTLLKQIAEK